MKKKKKINSKIVSWQICVRSYIALSVIQYFMKYFILSIEKKIVVFLLFLYSFIESACDQNVLIHPFSMPEKQIDLCGWENTDNIRNTSLYSYVNVDIHHKKITETFFSFFFHYRWIACLAEKGNIQLFGFVLLIRQVCEDIIDQISNRLMNNNEIDFRRI
jgi:hypothetical protein